jgi:hypothetical protein
LRREKNERGCQFSKNKIEEGEEEAERFQQ